MGGTLAAGTYYYKVTTLGADTSSIFDGINYNGWHGSAEFLGLDVMADWLEAYGFFDNPTVYTYHHLADIVGGGGDSHFDHFWPQLGQVGIAQPFGMGAGNSYENIRVDFTRLEGFLTGDSAISVLGGVIDGSCTASNAVTINTGQDPGLSYLAGTCDQFLSTGAGTKLTGVTFLDNNGFGPTQKTADIALADPESRALNVHGGYQVIPSVGVLSGGFFDPGSQVFTFVTGPTPNVQALYKISPNDSSPISYTGFMNVRIAQDFYIYGGNANVTIQNNSFTHTCTGHDINLGSVNGLLHFHFISPGLFGDPAGVAEDCDPLPAQAMLSSSETVTFSATPTFSIATRASIITLTANVTSFTLAAGADGQEKTLSFCQDATGGFTAAAPSNVHGFFTVGTTANKCSSQHFTYAAGQSAWLADSPGVANE
jgi:hypothetical protein